jgi:DNA-directed RNA polymerase sigma subunit (sigma70/sigma32)
LLPEYLPLDHEEEILSCPHAPEKPLSLRAFLAEVICMENLTASEQESILYRCGMTDGEWHDTDETLAHLGGHMTAEALDAAERKAFAAIPHIGLLLRHASNYLEHARWRVTPRKDMILRYHWGLTDGSPHTFLETAEHFGITRERVRQIDALAMRLSGRSIHRSRKLQNYID